MKVISIVTTNHCIAFDDRVNKESISLMQRGFSVQFIALEAKNEKGKGTTPLGASFQTIRLLARKYFPSGKAIPIKLLEWNIRILFLLLKRKWDIIWINDFDGMIAIPYARFIKFFRPSRKIIWDHHELAPERLLNSRFYRWLIGGCDIVLQANAERIEYTVQKLPQKYHSRFFVVENYPGIDFMNTTEQQIDPIFYNWLAGNQYCLFQGAALTYRKVLECVDAVRSLPEMRMVIMGPCDDKTRETIKVLWPDYETRIFITGWVAQSVFFRYMDKAITSLVFYENIDTNHWLCAPNRFYNAILRGIPVICGPNPPMKRIVEKDLIGISCLANGDDSVEIAEAIIKIRDSYSIYKSNCLKVRNQFVWQNQESVFTRILSDINL